MVKATAVSREKPRSPNMYANKPSKPSKPHYVIDPTIFSDLRQKPSKPPRNPRVLRLDTPPGHRMEVGVGGSPRVPLFRFDRYYKPPDGLFWAEGCYGREMVEVG